MATLELFGAAWCPHTQEMREWLEWQRREFVEYDVEADSTARQRLHELASGVSSIPVLIEDNRVVEVGWQGRSCMINAGALECSSSSLSDVVRPTK